MQQARLTTGFGSYRDTDLEQKAQQILVSMTGNLRFPTPTPTLPVLQEATDAYRQALVRIDDGNKETTVVKNQRRDQLIVLLNQLALYVQMVTQGDEASMLSSGFDLAKARTPVGILPKPNALHVEPASMRGCLKVSVNKIKGASTYLFGYTTAPVTPDSVWTDEVSSKTSVLIESLTSGR